MSMTTVSKETPLVEGEDFYREGAVIVFTAAYHLRRGYCCASGCRHCPYDGVRAGEAEHEDVSVETQNEK